jgi:aspartyl-tRNA(Asn)/glutamyl-tRNA(Gln) amidotransferase subunit A
MNHNLLLNQTACEQARKIKAKTLSAQSLLSQQQHAIAQLNPTINAFVQVSKAVASDELPEMSVLAGSTFAVKDNIDVQGRPKHGGMRALHAQPASQDAPVVARLKAAGMVCLGKLNMHAMALGATNHNADFGNCYNPVRAGYTPGGSSGGSAAAVAAGLCGIALGTDTLGSVRIPAAYCGVVGFKPSFGALPTDGVIPLSRLLDHVGILARGVEDVIAAFAAMTGSKQGTSDHLPSSPGSSALHLALPADLDELGLTDEVRHAFEQGTQRLQQAGHILHTVDFSDCGFPALRKAGLFLCEAELRDTLSQTLQAHRGDMPPDLLGMLDFISQRSAQDIGRAVATLVRGGQFLTQRISAFDALLLPTTPHTAFDMQAATPHNQADLTAMANMSGAPAISLPLPVAPDALPVGLQIVGHRGHDAQLLAIAHALEKDLLSNQAAQNKP